MPFVVEELTELRALHRRGRLYTTSWATLCSTIYWKRKRKHKGKGEGKGEAKGLNEVKGGWVGLGWNLELGRPDPGFKMGSEGIGWSSIAKFCVCGR